MLADADALHDVLLHTAMSPHFRRTRPSADRRQRRGIPSALRSSIATALIFPAGALAAASAYAVILIDADGVVVHFHDFPPARRNSTVTRHQLLR